MNQYACKYCKVAGKVRYKTVLFQEEFQAFVCSQCGKVDIKRTKEYKDNLQDEMFETFIAREKDLER